MYSAKAKLKSCLSGVIEGLIDQRKPCNFCTLYIDLEHVYNRFQRIFSLIAILAVLVFPLLSPVLATDIELQEQKLYQLLALRDMPPEGQAINAWQTRELNTLSENLQKHYTPLIADDAVAIKLGKLVAFTVDGEEGVALLMPVAQKGNAYAQYLTGFCLSQLEREPEAMYWYGEAMLQGSQDAKSNLCIWADTLQNPDAWYQLARVYNQQERFDEEIFCIQALLNIPNLDLPRELWQGYIAKLQKRYSEALRHFLQASQMDAQSHIAELYQNNEALFDILKADLFGNGDFEANIETLISIVALDASYLEEIKNLPDPSSKVCCIRACAQLCTMNILQPKSSKNRKKKRKPPSIDMQDKGFQVALDQLFEAAETFPCVGAKLQSAIDRCGDQKLFGRYAGWLEQKGQTNLAQRYLEKAQPRTPLKPAATLDWINIGAQLFASKKYNQALAAFAKSEQDPPGFSLAYCHYKEFCRTNEQAYAETARKILKLLSRKQDNDGRTAKYVLAKLNFASGKREAAQTAWEELADSGHGQAAYRVGLMLCDNPDSYAQAEEFFKKATENGVSKAFCPWASMADRYGSQDNQAHLLYQGASQGNQKCLDQLVHWAREGKGSAALNLGVYYFEQQDFDQAEQYWNEIEEEDDNLKFNGLLKFNLGRLAYARGNHEEALGFFRQSAELRCPGAFVKVGMLEANAENYQKAIDALEQALSNGPRFASILFNLGKLYWQENNVAKATDYFSEADLSGHEDAFGFLKSIFRENPDDPRAALNLAGAYCKRGYIQETFPLLELTIEKDEGICRDTAYFNICAAYFSQSNVEEVCKWLARARAVGEVKYTEYLKAAANGDFLPKEDPTKKLAQTILERLKI